MRTLKTALITLCLVFFVNAKEEENLFTDLIEFLKSINPLTRVIETTVERPKLERLKRDLNRVSESIDILVKMKQELIVKIAKNDIKKMYRVDPDIRNIEDQLRKTSNAFDNLFSQIPAEYKTSKNPFVTNINELMHQKELAVIALLNMQQDDKVTKEVILKKSDELKELGTKIELKINDLIEEINKKLNK